MITLTKENDQNDVLKPMEKFLNIILEDPAMETSKFAKREFNMTLYIKSIAPGKPGQPLIILKPTIVTGEKEQIGVPFNPNFIHSVMQIISIFYADAENSKTIKKVYLDDTYRLLKKHVSDLTNIIAQNVPADEITKALGVTYVMNTLSTGKVVDEVVNFILNTKEEEPKEKSKIILPGPKVGLNFSDVHKG